MLNELAPEIISLPDEMIELISLETEPDGDVITIYGPRIGVVPEDGTDGRQT